MKELTMAALSDSAREERVDAVKAFGFTDRQARFLVHVLVHSGVFIERQYRTFAGIVHGQKTHEFLAKLVGHGYATAITPGAVHRGRLFHVQYKPLYEAIGEPNNRNRKPASLGRHVERLMLLDAVLADKNYTWLGTENDKLTYFILGPVRNEMRKHEYPHVTFGEGGRQTVRYFPDKLPIGVAREGWRHVFVYLVTREVPADFRAFLYRHAELFRSLQEWTVRVLVPRRFRNVARLYHHAFRDELATPLTSATIEELRWYFRTRNGLTEPAPDPDLDLARATKKFGAARFRALYRRWECEGDRALWSAQSLALRDHLYYRRGRIEFAELSHQYLQLTPLIGVA